MRMKERNAVLLLAGTLAAACTTHGRDESIPVASLSGTWMLNDAQTSGIANLSSSPYETRDTVRGLPAPLREPPIERTKAVLEQRAERLTIVHDSASITFRFLNGNGNSPPSTPRTQSTDRTSREHLDAVVVTVVPDWRMVRTVWFESDSAEVRARWENGRLRIERRHDDGITVSEYYSRGAGAPYLVQYVVVRGPSGSEVTVRRVYDRAE